MFSWPVFMHELFQFQQPDTGLPHGDGASARDAMAQNPLQARL
jgi:hypothetical protein